MYIIDHKRFERALKERGFGSIGEFAKALGVHRNTIHHYLSGRGVLPSSVEKAIRLLNLRPQDILIDSEESDRLKILEVIAAVVDRLHMEFPGVSFVLFGSRARDANQKYSDWDLGAYSSGGLPHETYRKIVKLKNELSEDLPYFIDVVNLNRADGDFLMNVSKDWQFLTGNVSDWIALQRKAAA